MPKHDYTFKVCTRGPNGMAEAWDVIYDGVSIGIVKRHTEYFGRYTLAEYGGNFCDRVSASHWLLSQLRRRNK